MDVNVSWRERYEELNASLRRIGGILGDKGLPGEERERAAAEFVTTWQAFCKHLKDNPNILQAV